MRKLITLLFVVSILVLCNNQKEKGFADKVIKNANIYTLSWSNPSLEGKPAGDAH